MFGPLGSGILSSLVLNGVALPQADPVYHLRDFLDLQILLKEQVAIAAWRAFAVLCVIHKLCPFLDYELYSQLLMPWSSLEHGNALEEYPEASTGQNVGAQKARCTPRRVHITTSAPQSTLSISLLPGSIQGACSDL